MDHPKIIQKLRDRKDIHKQMHWLPRIIFATAGFLILLTGIAMLILPGPAIIVIPIGLAVLSLEFVWAERLLEKVLVSGISITSSVKKIALKNNWFLAAAGLLAILAIGSFVYIFIRFF